MDTNLLGLGINIMLAGMGAVFVFLTALVGATTLMSRLVMRGQPRPAVAAATPEEVAAITAAIVRHSRAG